MHSSNRTQIGLQRQRQKNCPGHFFDGGKFLDGGQFWAGGQFLDGGQFLAGGQFLDGGQFLAGGQFLILGPDFCRPISSANFLDEAFYMQSKEIGLANRLQNLPDFFRFYYRL